MPTHQQFLSTVFALCLMAQGDARAQADSVSARRPLPNGPQSPPAQALAQITESPYLESPGIRRNMAPDDGCPTAYRNNTGVVLAVTVGAPARSTAIVYTSPTQTAVWQKWAYAFNSATSQAYVQPGGWYCPVGIDSTGSFWVTVFKANAPQSEYLTRYTIWTEVPDGIDQICRPSGDSEVCDTTSYFIRTYLDGRTPERIRVAR